MPIANPSTPCGWPPLKLPYRRFRGGRLQVLQSIDVQLSSERDAIKGRCKDAKERRHKKPITGDVAR
jgi:hypothetical protein